MGCGCDGLSSVRQGGWCSLTWITWTVGGAKVRLAWVVIIWLCIYRVDSQWVLYMGVEIPRSFTTYSPSRLGCHN